MFKLKWSYIPPLLIYASAGVSGVTSVVGIFFLKDYLNLSASFIASIAFWAGIPWALKMPVGFLVDKYWNYKNFFVYVGAFLITLSLLIMYFLLMNIDFMVTMYKAETWFIISAIIAPIGYVLQDVVADAMTVEAVDPEFKKVSSRKINLNNSKKSEHTIIQLYGRFAIISGSLIVGVINLYLFKDINSVSNLNLIYAKVYLIGLIIPMLSISGVLLSKFNKKNNFKAPKFKLEKLDYQIFIGSCFFVVFTLILGSLNFVFSKEIILISSLILISILIRLLIKTMNNLQQRTIIGTAVIIFVFRSMPSPGAGLNWFEIDILGFDQSFFALLSTISAAITLLGMVVFKRFMINSSIAKLFAILTLLSGILYLPSILMYYNFHEYTSSITNGVVDARFIAILNTAAESPLSQVAMIPLLAWIAKNAPSKYKATFFAIFASFTNLALSTKELLTTYLNKVFIIKREIIDKDLGKVIEEANYSDLDNLLISILIITMFVPLATILIVQKSKLRSLD